MMCPLPISRFPLAKPIILYFTGKAYDPTRSYNVQYNVHNKYFPSFLFVVAEDKHTYTIK